MLMHFSLNACYVLGCTYLQPPNPSTRIHPSHQHLHDWEATFKHFFFVFDFKCIEILIIILFQKVRILFFLHTLNIYVFLFVFRKLKMFTSLPLMFALHNLLSWLSTSWCGVACGTSWIISWYPHDHFKSDIASLIIGYSVMVVFFVLQYPMSLLSARLDNSHRLLKIAYEDVIIALATWGVLNVWRGEWDILKEYFLPDQLIGGWCLPLDRNSRTHVVTRLCKCWDKWHRHWWILSKRRGYIPHWLFTSTCDK